jgi:hypothetical protein
LKCGSLNFLETSGPVQACLGIAFYGYPRTMNSTPKEMQCKTINILNLTPDSCKEFQKTNVYSRGMKI